MKVTVSFSRESICIVRSIMSSQNSDIGKILHGLQAYHKALIADPMYKPASENLAIVLTDIGTSLKLSGNVQEGLQKYYDALKADSHYAV